MRELWVDFNARTADDLVRLGCAATIDTILRWRREGKPIEPGERLWLTDGEIWILGRVLNGVDKLPAFASCDNRAVWHTKPICTRCGLFLGASFFQASFGSFCSKVCMSPGGTPSEEELEALWQRGEITDVERGKR